MQTRLNLLLSAEKIFGKKGYYDTSISDITRDAEVAQGTFYKYFSSKKEIFEELVKQLSHDFRSEIREAIQQAKNAKEIQEIGIRTFLQWVKHHRNLYSIIQQTVLVDESLYRWYYEKIASGYIKGINDGIMKGEFKPLNPEAVAYSLMGIGQFIGMRWVYWGEEDISDEIVESVLCLIFDGLSK